MTLTDIDISLPAVTIEIAWDQAADRTVGLPSYQTQGAAGMDIRANLPADQRVAGVAIQPGGRALVPTGLRVAVPMGYELQVRPRSGLALSHGITCLNSPGTIDADYRGVIGVLLINLGESDYSVAHGDRIAQLVLAETPRCRWKPVPALAPAGSTRVGGFGSTGR